MSHSQSLAHFLYTVLPEGCSKGAKMWCWSAHPKINQICGWLSYMLGISWYACYISVRLNLSPNIRW